MERIEKHAEVPDLLHAGMLSPNGNSAIFTPSEMSESDVTSADGAEDEKQQHHLEQSSKGAAVVSALCLLPASSAFAAIHAEPANALSLPTWAIHISSTVEWGTAMYLFWRYAEVTGTRSPPPLMQCATA